MDQDIYNKKTRNWVKGNFALNTARKALCGCIQDTFETFISSLTAVADVHLEDVHLEQFFKCLKANDIQQLKQLKQTNPNMTRKKTKRQLQCEHELCRSLMGEFVKIHTESGSLCDCYQWSTVSSGYSSIDEKKPKQSMAKSDKIWQITVLYMYVDRGESAEQYGGLEDLDISKVIKIMGNCSKFVTDGSSKLYEKVIEWRNVVMHSSNHNLDDEDMKKMLHHSKKLLNCLQISTTSYYITATQYLQKLEDNDIYIGYESKEVKQLLEKVSHAKETAVELDNCILPRNTEGKIKSKCLLELLEQICPTGTPQMMFEPKAYKDKLKSCVEKQKEVVNSDISSSNGYNREKLLQLRDDIEQYLEDIDEVIDESDTEEMTKFLGHMEKENNTIKEAIKRAEIEKRKLETNLQEQKRLRDNIDMTENVNVSRRSALKGIDIYRRRREIKNSSHAQRDSGSPTTIASDDSDSSDSNYEGIKEERSNNIWDEGNNVPDHTPHHERRAHKSYYDYDGLEKSYMKQPDAEADDTMYKSSYRKSRDSEARDSEEDKTFSENNSGSPTLIASDDSDSSDGDYKGIKEERSNHTWFVQNRGLLTDLIATHPKILVEASVSNTTWGIGLNVNSPFAWDESTWKGKNCLGYVLTEVRDDIMIEQGLIAQRGRKMYTDNLLKDTANLSKTESGGGVRSQRYESDTSEIYIYFESGIYSMSHRSNFTADGQTFRSLQQYLMFKKAELFEDYEIAKEILATADPTFLQQKGREVNGFKEGIWERYRLQIAKDGNLAKNKQLLDVFVSTYPKEFVMASPTDKIWGIGLAEQDPRSRDKNTWNGKNYFGKILTEARNMLLSYV